jgi:TPR repeat protein
MDILLFSYDMAKGERIPMAIAWFEKMAEKGHAGSMRELGNLYYAYYRGYEDKDKAEVWYRKGAHAGDSEAQYKMGMFFSKTLIEKKEWLEKAAHQGFEDAISRLKEYDRGRPDVVYANLIPVPSDDKANYHLLSLEESLTSKTIVVGRDANDSYNNVNFEIKCGSFEYRSPGDKNRYFTATKLSSDQNKLIMHDIIDFICNVRGSTDTSILLNVSADRKANYYLISKSSLKNGNLIVTSRREGPSGTGFSKREINCQDNSFRYLGDGSTLEEMNATYNVGQMRRAKKDDVYTGISHDVIQAVCE